jgi:hypothetical protein
MRIDRVVELEKARLIMVELTEFVEIGGESVETPEALIFDLDSDGLIAHISIYIQTLARTPPAV